MFLIIRSRRRRAPVLDVLDSLRHAAGAASSRAPDRTVGRGDGVPRAATPSPRGAKDLHVLKAVAARADKKQKNCADPSGTALYDAEAPLRVPKRRGNKS